MRLGIIGFGYMGTHLARKLLGANHECVVLNSSPIAMDALAETEALITFSLEEFIQQLPSPRIVWMTIPEALLDQLLTDIAPYLYVGDILVNGSNSYFTLKKSRTDRGLNRNWPNQPYNSNYGQHAAYREVADFTNKIISMMCFEYSDYDKLQSNHHVLQRLMKHGYQKVHTDYQSVLNQ